MGGLQKGRTTEAIIKEIFHFSLLRNLQFAFYRSIVCVRYPIKSYKLWL